MPAILSTTSHQLNGFAIVILILSLLTYIVGTERNELTRIVTEHDLKLKQRPLLIKTLILYFRHIYSI